MKTTSKFFFSLSLAALCFSCNDIDLVGEQPDDQQSQSSELVKGVTAQVADFKFDDSAFTRSSHTFSSSTGYSFVWEQGDTLGIFPVESNQVEFPVKDGIGTNKAVFNGGAWALRANYHYASYYPFSSDNYHRKITELPVDYTDQTVDGNNPLAHLGKYDFLYSAPAETSDNGYVNLNLQHLGCFVLFRLTLPEAGSYKRLTLTTDNVPFIYEATFDLSAPTPVLTSKKSYTDFSINLTNITASTPDEVVDITAMFAPVNLSGKTIKLSLYKDDGKIFSTTVAGKNMVSGQAYGYAPSVSFTGEVDESCAYLTDGTTFNRAIKTLAYGSTRWEDSQDKLIKKVVFDCLSSKSTGTLVSKNTSPYPIYANYASGVITISTPAAKVFCEDMSKMFKELQAVTSIDLSHFKTENTKKMKEMFEWCMSLESIDLSHMNTQNVTDMDDMFLDCSSLSSLDVSNFNTQNVTDMSGMFMFCEALTALDVSGFNTQNVKNMSAMFYGCKSLLSLDVSNFNTANVEGMDLMFCNCSKITSLDISKFDTSKTIRKSGMFGGCHKLTSLDLGSAFSSENISPYLNDMFTYCVSLTNLDLSQFNTKNAIGMDGMFKGCTKLTQLDLSNFDTSNLESAKEMFMNCYNLSTLNLTGFNTAKLTTKTNMCSNLAKTSESCTISCSPTTQSALQTGTSLNADWITWNIQE